MDKCISQVDSETKYWFPHWSQFNFYKFQVRVWSKLLDHGQDFFQIYCILAITSQLQLQSWHSTTLSSAEDSDELLATLHCNPQRSNASINHLWERPLWWPNRDSTFDWKPRNSIGSKKTKIASRVVVAYLATSWLLRAARVSSATAISFMLECWKLQKSALGSEFAQNKNFETWKYDYFTTSSVHFWQPEKKWCIFEYERQAWSPQKGCSVGKYQPSTIFGMKKSEHPSSSLVYILWSITSAHCRQRCSIQSRLPL